MPSTVPVQALTPSTIAFNGTRFKHEGGNDKESDMGTVVRRDTGEAPNQIGAAAADVAKSLQSCPTLCDPIDSSPPGSPVPGILQVRTLEWVAISFSNA